MKKLISGSVVTTGLLMAALPAPANTSYDYATVLESIPVYQTIEVSTPRQECWNERVVSRHYDDRQRSNTPVIISTIIGGALGNAVGNGKSNRRIGTAVGAVLGHSVGRDIVRHNSRSSVDRYEDVRRCDVVDEYYEQERLVGYHVRYEYNGEEYTVRMDHDPGEQIQVKVRVEPVR